MSHAVAARPRGVRRCAPMSTPTDLGIPEHLFTAIDHVGIAVRRPRRGDRVLRDTFGMRAGPRGDQRGAGRPRGDDGRRRLRLLHPAARPAERRSPRSRSSSTAPARACSSWPTGSPTSRRSARSCASAASACCTTRRGAARRTRGSTSSTPRTPAGCSSSWSSPRRRVTLRRRPHPRSPDRLLTGNLRRQIASAAASPQETNPCSTSSTPSSPATPTPEDFANLALPESYRAVTVHKDEVDMFEGLATPATRTRASRCTSRTSRCPSSARARRSSP